MSASNPTETGARLRSVHFHAGQHRRSDPMTGAMLRLVVRTNIVLLALAGLAYIIWAERPGGTAFGLVLCGVAIVAWQATARVGR